jgi:hypothetical protein
MTISQLEDAVGGLSNPDKMPWLSYNLPASDCKVGSVLQARSGSVCADCYALTGRYRFPNVQKAMTKRLKAIQSPDWVGNMSELIRRKSERIPADRRYFRWHDSGDIQSFDHLLDIITIARNVPGVQFWLPTKEYGLINRLHKSQRPPSQAVVKIPSNLCIRVSAPDIDQYLPVQSYDKNAPWRNTSAVVPYSEDERWDIRQAQYTAECPATVPGEDHHCNQCRACWDTDEPVVTYYLH